MYENMNYEPWCGDKIKAHMDFKDENGNLILKKGDIMDYHEFVIKTNEKWRYIAP